MLQTLLAVCLQQQHVTILFIFGMVLLARSVHFLCTFVEVKFFRVSLIYFFCCKMGAHCVVQRRNRIYKCDTVIISQRGSTFICIYTSGYCFCHVYSTGLTDRTLAVCFRISVFLLTAS